MSCYHSARKGFFVASPYAHDCHGKSTAPATSKPSPTVDGLRNAISATIRDLEAVYGRAVASEDDNMRYRALRAIAKLRKARAAI
jgi:hypothetical protein